MDTLTGDRTIGPTTAASEAEWLAWLSVSAPAPLAVPVPTRRLIVVAPHPDDEVLMAAGLMQRHLAAGGKVTILAVTDGEASHPVATEAQAERLASARQSERLQGLAQLGIPAEAVTRLRFPDGAVQAHCRKLSEMIRACLKPDDIVVTTWRLDGHPDHDATGAAAAQATAATGCVLLEAPVWMWHWSRPEDLRVPWDRLRRAALTDAEVAVKGSALASHATQFERRGDLGPVLDGPIVARAKRGAEYFFV